MKQVFKSFLILIAVFVVLNIFGANNSNAASVSGKTEFTNQSSDFLVIVRSEEEGRHFISVYTDTGILVMKAEEL